LLGNLRNAHGPHRVSAKPAMNIEISAEAAFDAGRAGGRPEFFYTNVKQPREQGSASRGAVAPEVLSLPSDSKRAQGMPGVRHTRSLERNEKSVRAIHHRCAETSRHSLRDGFNGLSRALPGDRAFLPPQA
jgi:hypothetical protein